MGGWGAREGRLFTHIGLNLQIDFVAAKPVSSFHTAACKS